MVVHIEHIINSIQKWVSFNVQFRMSYMSADRPSLSLFAGLSGMNC